jgi:hypothetical protein
VTGTQHFVALGEKPTMHHVVEPRPLRGQPETVRTRCGLSGPPKKLVKNVDERAVRVCNQPVCVNCTDLAGVAQ